MLDGAVRVEDVGRDFGLLVAEPELGEVDGGAAVDEDEGFEVGDALRGFYLVQKLRPPTYWNYLVENVLGLEYIGEDDGGADGIGVVGDEHPDGGALAEGVLLNAGKNLDDVLL